LLGTLTPAPTESPVDYAEQIEISPHDAFVTPLKWDNKSTKRKVFELCIIDKYTHQQASITIGITRQRVSQIASEILSVIDKL
jgi:hypothetical protein